MTTFTGSDSFPAAITGPDPGQPITAASVVDGDTLLADRTIWLYNRVAGRGYYVEIATAVSSTGDSDAGPANSFDMKSITTWTDVPDAEVSTVEDIAPGDILQVRAYLHAEHIRADAGFLGLRAVVSYDVLGTPLGFVSRRRWIGSPASGSLQSFIPVSLDYDTAVAADASGPATLKLQAMVTSVAGGADSIFLASPWRVQLGILRMTEPA